MLLQKITDQAGQPVNVPQLQALQGRMGGAKATVGIDKGAGGVFADLLKTKINGLKFSAHAATRMSSITFHSP